ncbi:MAG TPA: SDR family oxidoreductase [Steroidobacteraceae bacterium]|nr:SDR family oxidoreductase [Steroidobacteraceae bacterium]
MTARPQTVLITGANTGIGLEFTRQYAHCGARVIATYRGAVAAPELSQIAGQYPAVEPRQMDVTDEAEVHSLATSLGEVAVDILINNAGVYCEPDGSFATQSIGAFRFALLDRIMAVNLKGALLVSEAFLPHLRAGQARKLVCISSTNGSLTQPFPGGGATFYRASKAALNRAMQVVAEELREQRIAVLLIHPGMVRTERFFEYRQRRGVTQPAGPDSVDSAYAVAQMIRTIGEAGFEERARFMLYDGTALPW